MNYYPRNIGDILKATMGMSLAERGAYDALLDQYYAHERPLPKDRREVYRLASAATPAERKAVDYVLAKFFKEQADGWHQKRADEEIARFGDKAGKAAASARSRWREHNANAMRTHTERTANALPTQCDGNANQEPNISSMGSNAEIPQHALEPVDNPAKNGRNSKATAPPPGWRRDPDAAALYASKLGVTTLPGETTEQLVRRIDRYVAEQTRDAVKQMTAAHR